MPDLSVKQYLQTKGAIPNQGIRSCAPSLSTISLRSLLRGINRRIIHLSDLHIGLNNGTIPEIQVQNIIDAIIRAYPQENDSYEYPRPIIVITGDLVDFYSTNSLDTISRLLNKLRVAGFTVLVVPGNHDYSESFSTDSFTKLENIPIVGDMIKVAALIAEEYIGNGQDPNLVSGMTFIPDAASNFRLKMAQYLGNNGHQLESWKDRGAVFDLDFILLDGQDQVANRPDWDDPKRFVREKVHDAVLAFDKFSSLYYRFVDYDKNKLANTIADAVADTIAVSVANLVLDPAAIYGTVFTTVLTIEKTAYESAWNVLLAAALLDPTIAATVVAAKLTADPIATVFDCGLASTVATVAAAWVFVPLDDKYFMHDASVDCGFRLAHGYLDSTRLQSFRNLVNKDHVSQTLPIACVHYWLNYPKMDPQYNNSGGSFTLINETELFDTLDKCHLLLVGHIHENSYGRIHTFQTSTKQNSLANYSRAGSTCPDPVDWQDDYKRKARQSWIELSINLNTGKISPPYIFNVDGNKHALQFDMDRLQPGQRLNVNNQLVSNNGWFNLVMQGDGDLVLYRTQIGQPLWKSNTAKSLADHVIMQRDGNLVICSQQGAIYYNTGTSGHQDSQLVLQDDGNLVIYDSANKKQWESNTAVKDISSPTSMPTIAYADTNGYKYDEASESWKQMCSALPCFTAVQFPGYATKVIDTIDGKPLIIDGQQVVIQLWKGWCGEKVANFIGGIGAEVGVYRQIPGRLAKTLPLLQSLLHSFPKEFADLIRNNIDRLTDDNVWWPFPELNAKLEFTLVNPITGETFFSAGPENSYWLCKWMYNDSYSKYQQDQGNSNTPTLPVDYILEYKINGKSYPRW